MSLHVPAHPCSSLCVYRGGVRWAVEVVGGAGAPLRPQGGCVSPWGGEPPDVVTVYVRDQVYD